MFFRTKVSYHACDTMRAPSVMWVVSGLTGVPQRPPQRPQRPPVPSPCFPHDCRWPTSPWEAGRPCGWGAPWYSVPCITSLISPRSRKTCSFKVSLSPAQAVCTSGRAAVTPALLLLSSFKERIRVERFYVTV